MGSAWLARVPAISVDYCGFQDPSSHASETTSRCAAPKSWYESYFHYPTSQTSGLVAARGYHRQTLWPRCHAVLPDMWRRAIGNRIGSRYARAVLGPSLDLLIVSTFRGVPLDRYLLYRTRIHRRDLGTLPRQSRSICDLLRAPDHRSGVYAAIVVLSLHTTTVSVICIILVLSRESSNKSSSSPVAERLGEDVQAVR